MKKFDLTMETLTNLLVLIGVMALLIMSAYSFSEQKSKEASVISCNNAALARVNGAKGSPTNLEQVFLYDFFFNTCQRSAQGM